MRSLSLALASLPLLAPLVFAQGGSRVAEPVGGAINTGPNTNMTPDLNLGGVPGMNAGTQLPNVNINTGVSGINQTPTAQQQALTVTGQNPSATQLRGNGATPSMNAPVTQQNARGQNMLPGAGNQKAVDPSSKAPVAKTATMEVPAGVTPITAAPSGGNLNTAVTEIKKAETLDAGSDGIGVASALKKVFDASAAGKTLKTLAALPGGSVAGKQQHAEERVMHLASVAETQAAPHEAAEFYKNAVTAAQQAEKEKTMTSEAAVQAVNTVMSYAAAHAKKALPELATAAYKAAALGLPGAREVSRALKGLDQWEALLGKKNQPLISNLAQIKTDVARFQEAASQPGASVQAPEIRFKQADGSYTAVLPRGKIAAVPETIAKSMELTTDPTAPLMQSWLDDVLVAHSRNPGADPSLLFETARRGAKSALVPAAASAAALTVRAWFAAVWQWLKSLVASLFGRSDALVSVRRAPTSEEVALAPAGAQSLDLSQFNAPYLEAQRLLGDAAPTAASVKAAVAAARRLAAAHEKLTGDASGAQSLEKLSARIDADERVSSVDVRLLDFWVQRLYASTMGAVLAPLAKNAAKGPVVFYDLTPGSGMVGVISAGLDADALQRAGFDVRGGNVAVFGPGGSSEELAAAFSAASGKIAKSTPKSQPAALEKAILFAKSKPGEAEALAASLQAEMSLSATLAIEALGRVAADGGSMTVSRVVRNKGKGSEEFYLMTQPTTGRVFGYKAALPR